MDDQEQEKGVICEEEEGKFMKRGTAEYLEEEIEFLEEKILLASCRIVKIFRSLDEREFNPKRIMANLNFESFREACEIHKDSPDETEGVTMSRANRLHQKFKSDIEILFSMPAEEIPLVPYDAHELKILRKNLGEDLYRTVRKAFRELRVAAKTGVRLKPWNLQEDREASLLELVEKIPAIAYRRRHPRRRDDC